MKSGSVEIKLRQMYWCVLISLWLGIGNVSAAAGSGIEPVGQWGYGSNEAVFINGNYAYIGSGSVLVVLDVSDKTNPRKSSDVLLEGFIESIYVSGNHAYIANNESGLKVVDVSNAGDIHEVGRLDTPGNASDVFVSGHYAFVADNSSGLRIIDISNPLSPVEAGSYVTNGDITGVFVSGEYAYVCAYDKGFRVIDISKPSSPREIGSISYGPDNDGKIKLNKIRASGNYAYVTSDQGLRIIDVSNPSSPVEVGFHSSGYYAVDVSGKYVYTGGLVILDVSNPASPQEVGSLSLGYSYVEGLHAAGNYVFATAGNHLAIIDVTTPTSPTTTGAYMTPGASERIRVEGNIAYMVNPSSGLRLIDISNPAVPVEKGFYDSPGIMDVFIAGDYAYAAVGYGSPGGSGLHIIDVSDPAAPQKVGSYNCPYGGIAQSVWIAGNYAYLGYGVPGSGLLPHYGGLIVLDITDPNAPREKGNLHTYYIKELFVRGNYAYTAYMAQTSHYFLWGGMDIIDLSNPISPVIVGTTKSFGCQSYGLDIHISGNYAYLILGSEQFYKTCPTYMEIIDVSDPASPRLTATHQNKGFTNGVYGSGNYAYTADGSKGLRIINISRPFSPAEITYYDTPGDARDVFVSGDYIFVADGKCGMIILKHISSFTERPFIVTDKTRLFFGAAPGVCTGPQEVSVANGTVGTLNWTAAAGQDWMTVTPLSGTGDGRFNVAIDPSGLSSGTYTGSVNIADPNASNSPQAINVTLVVDSNADDSAPFGTFETPREDSNVVRSWNVPLTGWALDNIETLHVRLYREPVAEEGSGLVYIGDAVFVEGARPDVEVAYPAYPLNYKAGWGYMMLTKLLPNGGNGTFTLHAIATDNSGHQVILGTKTITCENYDTRSPFGAIDTPNQGGNASGGKFVNWGWVLTPPPNIIPIDGSTINVFVDGVYIGHPTYNIYRSDIADLFPDCANGTGAGGYFYLDTTAYANGVHTIHWSATDDGGYQDGVGSNYFKICNFGNNSSKQFNQSNVAPKTSIPDIPQILHIPVDCSAPVKVKRGYKEDTEPGFIQADEKDMYRINIKEVERVQIHLTGGGDENPTAESLNSNSFMGYLEVNNCLKSLPIGSTLDTQRGIFYWQPGVGFVGEYHLVFVKKDDSGKLTRKNISIEIKPKL